MRIGPVQTWLLAALLAPAAAQAFRIQTADGTNALATASGDVLPKETLLIGQELDIRGRAERDLWLAGTTVQMDGESDGDLRVLARSVALRGEMRRNLLAYAAGLHLATGAVVRGDAALLGNHVISEGRVEGDAWILATSATLGGTWGGTVRVQADEIRVAPGTVIAGDLVYAAPKAPVLDASVTVGGEVRPRASLLPEAAGGMGATFRNRLWLHGFLFLAALLVGMPFVGVFPLLAGGAVRNLQAAPWRSFVSGLIVLGPFLIGFALMTLVGIPLALRWPRSCSCWSICRTLSWRCGSATACCAVPDRSRSARCWRRWPRGCSCCISPPPCRASPRSWRCRSSSWAPAPSSPPAPCAPSSPCPAPRPCPL